MTMLTRSSILIALVLSYLLTACDVDPGNPDVVPAASDTAHADVYLARATHLADAAQYDSALVYFERAKVLFEAENDWEHVLRCSNGLGDSFRRKGDLVQAMEILNQALESGLVRLGEHHPEVAQSYNNIGAVLTEQNEFDVALEYHNRALSIRRAALGEQHPDVAQSYHNIGVIHDYKGEFDQALEFYNKAITIHLATQGEQQSEVADSYGNMGIVHYLLGDFDQALDFLIKALHIRLAALGEQHPDVAQSYNNIGLVHYARGDYDQALEFYNKANAIRIAVLGDEKHPDIAGSYGNIGVVYYFKGDYDRALEFFRKALAIHVTALGEQHPDVARDYNNMGGVYYDRSDYDRALEFFRKALAIHFAAHGGEQHSDVADGYNNLGLVHAARGDYDQALESYNRALSIRLATLGEQHPAVAESYHNLGFVYAKQGNSTKALDAYNLALRIRRAAQGEQHPAVAEGYNNMGDVYRESGVYGQALDHYAKALRIRRATLGEQHPDVAQSYTNLGLVHAARGNHNQALDLYQQALHANVPGFVTSNPYINPSLDSVFSEDILLKSLFAKATSLSTRYSEESGYRSDLEAAFSTYRLAADLIDRMRHGYKADGSKLFLAENATEIYDQAIQTAMKLHRETGMEAYREETFLFAEKSKAGVLLDAFAEVQAKEVAGIPDTLLQQEYQLRVDLAGYEINLARERSKPLGERNSAQISLWENKLFNLNGAYQDLIRLFEQVYLDYFNLKYQTRAVSVDTLQQKLLNNNTALLAYFVGIDSLYIFTLTQHTFDVRPVARDSLLERKIQNLRLGILTQDYDLYTRHAHQLYQDLIAPVRDQLVRKHLIVVPDGVLNYVPFEALLTQEARQNIRDYRSLPYFVEDHAVSYAYSATLLAQERPRKREESGSSADSLKLNITHPCKRGEPERDLLAFAPVFAEGMPSSIRKTLAALDTTWDIGSGTGALPASREEVQGIRGLFLSQYGFIRTLLERFLPSRSLVLLERKASEEKLKAAEAALYRYLHVATHGFVNEASPALSQLLLMPEDEDPALGQDGILHLAEVYTLCLNADLVALSACDTGLGQLARGEGVIGLTRGFLYAGAKSVLVSLWKVDDVQTRDLMVAFYGEMLKEAGNAEALQAAKMKLIQGQAKYAKPYYWAAFILVDGEIIQKKA